MPDQTPAEQPTHWNDISKEVFAGFLEALFRSDTGKFIMSNTSEVIGNLLAICYALTAPIGVGMAKGMATAEDLVAPAFADMAAAAVNDIFNVDVPASAFAAPRGGRARAAGGEALGKGLLNLIAGKGGALEPDDGPANRYVTAMAGTAIEDWFKGWFFEVLSSLVPQLDIGKIESYGALGDKVANVLGLSRISRSIIRPLADAAIVTPFQWKVNKLFTPQLLSPSQVARMVTRDPTKRPFGLEELARQGWSAARVTELLAANVRYAAASDVAFLVREQYLDASEAQQRLQADGYDPHEAELTLLADELQRVDGFRKQAAAAAVASYASRDIDSVVLENVLLMAYSDPKERQWARLVADHRKASNVRHLSLNQVEQMVRSGVLAMIDYRRAAAREGYPDDEITALELQLRWELDKAKAIQQHRQELEKERAAEKQQREREAAARKAQVEAARALQRRGSFADLKRAAVRGLIDIGRLEEILTPQYDVDTVAILVADVEFDRAAWLAQLEAREAAKLRASERSIDVGALEAAVLTGVVSVDEFRSELRARGFDARDTAILADTVAVRLEDRQRAEQARREAAEAARRRSIDLSRLEQLVRRGARSLTDYDRTLEDLGFDDASRAGMRELLELKTADDRKAADLRAAEAAAQPARGLSLEQVRRAVKLGVKTIEEFQAWLLEQRYTTDAQLVLVAELRDELAEAAAARARREAADRAQDTRALPIATVGRAAQLGLITPAAYEARLRGLGYSGDDVAIEVGLLVTEIADRRAREAARAAAAAASRARGVSLEQLARAVLRGLAPIDDYRAAVVAAGYTEGAADLIVALLEDERTTRAAAEERRAQIEAETGTRELSLAQLEAAVKGRVLTLPDFAGAIATLGYDQADAELLVALLASKLDAGADEGGTAS